MMTYFLHDSIDASDEIQRVGSGKPRREASLMLGEDVHILGEKLTVPEFTGLVSRSRLNEDLAKSVRHFNATLISGRAGTGKTLLAADFAQRYRRIAWYSVESTDIDWNVFARYFAASLLGSSKGASLTQLLESYTNSPLMSQFTEGLIREAKIENARKPTLIVLDNLHHVFDSAWFADFFQLLVSSLPENAHLLLLCRSKPPNPIWRMRSKQVLHVVDEKLLAFNIGETIELFKAHGLTEKAARKAHEDSFGRASKLAAIAKRLADRT